MALSTVGRVFFPGYELPLHYEAAETFDPDRGRGERFRLILVEDGTGILRLGQRREAFIAPALFCLDERDAPGLESASAVTARALYFHPAAINSAFGFERLRASEAEFSLTESQDTHMLTAFLQRGPEYGGHLPIDPPTARRLGGLFEAVAHETATQSHAGWPCRSRSFLIEALFVTERAYSAVRWGAALPVEPALQGEPDTVDAVIMYLHTHYQDKITIDDLARTFHTNRTTLTERMRAATGVPAMTYLTRLRIRLATALLHDTQVPISEIAARVGFTDMTHFGRTFRKLTGCTPSEYRHRYCWMQ